MADGCRDAARRRPDHGDGGAPRQQGHGDYATNVAMQLAKKAGTNPRDFAELVQTRLEAADGVAAVEVAGPGFLNITVDAGAQGAGRGRGRRRRGGVRLAPTRSPARRSTSSSSPPTRPGRSTSVAPAGRRWATRSAGSARGDRRRGDPRVLLQRPRRPDRPVRRSLLAAARGRAGARGRVRRRLHRRDRRARSSRSSPDVLDLPDDEAPGGLPRATASTLMFDGDQADACTTSASTSTSTSTRTTCTRAAPSADAIERLHRARQHLRGGRRPLAAPPRSSATTRTG